MRHKRPQLNGVGSRWLAGWRGTQQRSQRWEALPAHSPVATVHTLPPALRWRELRLSRVVVAGLLALSVLRAVSLLASLGAPVVTAGAGSRTNTVATPAVGLSPTSHTALAALIREAYALHAGLVALIPPHPSHAVAPRTPNSPDAFLLAPALTSWVAQPLLATLYARRGLTSLGLLAPHALHTALWAARPASTQPRWAVSAAELAPKSLIAARQPSYRTKRAWRNAMPVRGR